MTTTPSQTIGPLFGFALMFADSACCCDPSSPTAVTIRGRVFDGAGEVLAYPECMVELWSEEQFARTRTDPLGEYWAVMERPRANRLPTGALEAPHLEVAVMARGLLKHVMTRIYFPDEPVANESDPALGLVPAPRRHTLMAAAEEDCFRFDVHLQGANETVFFAY